MLWGVSYGSLYPALRRLEQAGAIESVEPVAPATAPSPATGSITGDLTAAELRSVADRVRSGSRRTRKAYRITARGDGLLVERCSPTTSGPTTSGHSGSGARSAAISPRRRVWSCSNAAAAAARAPRPFPPPRAHPPGPPRIATPASPRAPNPDDQA